jgi:hypothetical protein
MRYDEFIRIAAEAKIEREHMKAMDTSSFKRRGS